MMCGADKYKGVFFKAFSMISPFRFSNWKWEGVMLCSAAHHLLAESVLPIVVLIIAVCSELKKLQYRFAFGCILVVLPVAVSNGFNGVARGHRGPFKRAQKLCSKPPRIESYAFPNCYCGGGKRLNLRPCPSRIGFHTDGESDSCYAVPFFEMVILQDVFFVRVSGVQDSVRLRTLNCLDSVSSRSQVASRHLA